MSEIQGKSNFYYEHLPPMLVGALQDEGYFCMRYFKKIVGHGSNQREVISFTCHDLKVNDSFILVEVLEVALETSKVSIVGDGYNAWRKVTDIIRATGYVEFDDENQKPQSLKWKKDFLKYKFNEQIKIIYFEAMAASGSIPDNPKDMRQTIGSFLLSTPRVVDNKADAKGVFADWCSQEQNWIGGLTETSKRPDKSLRGNVKRFDVDTLLKFYRANIEK